jgi:hypothetical protein
MRAQKILIHVLPVVVLLAAACSGGRRAEPTASADLPNARETTVALAATAKAQGGSSGNDVLGTAQAFANTAQAGVNSAATLVSDAGATAVAFATESAPTAAALATQAVSLAQTAQAALTTITPPAIVGQADASAVINQYASDVLGISVTILKAGGLTTDVNRQINLSPEGEAAQSGSAKMAVATYGALLQGGAASVSYGSGTATGDISVDISGASLGAFSFDHDGAVTNEAEALALVLQTFPGLNTRTFTPSPTTKGFAWVAEGDVPGFDFKTMQASLVAEKVLIGVTPVGARKSSVYAVVGKGNFAAQVTP